MTGPDRSRLASARTDARPAVPSMAAGRCSCVAYTALHTGCSPPKGYQVGLNEREDPNPDDCCDKAGDGELQAQPGLEGGAGGMSLFRRFRRAHTPGEDREQNNPPRDQIDDNTGNDSHQARQDSRTRVTAIAATRSLTGSAIEGAPGATVTKCTREPQNPAPTGCRAPGYSLRRDYDAFGTCSSSTSVPQKSFGCRNRTGLLCAPSFGSPSPSTRMPSAFSFSRAS